MIVSFRDKQTKAIYDNESTKAAQSDCPWDCGGLPNASWTNWQGFLA